MQPPRDLEIVFPAPRAPTNALASVVSFISDFRLDIRVVEPFLNEYGDE
jgi:hypothetical protein